jgi:hypothetical protein
MVKKDGVNFYKQPHLYTMLPLFYQNCFQRQLKQAEYLTLQILVFLLQAHKQVSIESLATVMLCAQSHLRVEDAPFKDF